MSEVRVLRLVSGEDIITQISNDNDDNDLVVLREPQVMAMQPAGAGKISFAFIPFFPFSNSKDVRIKKSAIAMNEEPNVELLNNYNKSFGSGLVIAGLDSLPKGDGKGGILGARAM